MKIIHVLYSGGFSGAENVVCQIIDMFKNDENIRMVYCSLDGPIREVLNERKILFTPIRKLSVTELKRVIKVEKPDLIHAHDMRASFAVACVCDSIPFISHIHNNAFGSRNVSVKSIAYWFATKKAKHIFWVSNSAYEGYRFQRSVRGKSSVLYNVIDIDALYKKMYMDEQSYNYDIAYLGRLTFPKNPERLIYVLKKVVEQKHDIKIAIIGIGELEKVTKRLAADLKLNDNISFLGFRSNPLKILHDAKAMIMTSRWEGMPMCALEAMALGVPIVATPVDGLKSLVKNGETGLLSDNDSELALELVRIVSDRELHNKLSQNSVKLSRQINNLEAYKLEIMKWYEK